MNLQETEQDILNDLKELEDAISQYTYLITCAKECLALPEQYRNEEYLVKDCQVNTWMYADVREDQIVFLADSESLIVKGGLALLQELYHGRSVKEAKGYRCSLPEQDAFSAHFSGTQLKSLRAMVKRLEDMFC